MKAADFHTRFEDVGRRLLAPEGFVYKDRAWHLTAADHQLSLCPHCTKFGQGFSVRYLTVALLHLDVEPPPGWERRLLRNDCGSCPVRISPLLLRRHVESGFDDKVWDCPDPLDFDTRLGTCLPVYFGGEVMRILADPSATIEANREALLHSLERDGIDDLTEPAMLGRLEKACRETALFGAKWASRMTTEMVAPLVIRTAGLSADLAIHYYAPQYAKAVGQRASRHLE